MMIAGKTDVGAVRTSNQDSFAIKQLQGDRAYAVVCDGMGGANGGETASQMAVEYITKALDEGLRPNMSEKSVHLLFDTAVYNANINIYNKALNNEELKGMGTTVVLVYAENNMVYVAHVGDSRLYLINNDVFDQITRDHSVVQEMIENGQITPDEALNHPHKNIITRALGTTQDVFADFNVIEKNHGDILLLCSDGLSNYISKESIADIIRNNDFENLPNLLVDAAICGGGRDNITAVVIK